ncbi:MAG: hypothetical protein HRU19_08665 [Pseudobacteriovorax sp.]|nr:hypothetical protein [Pseudobacteriovorax sp.]
MSLSLSSWIYKVKAFLALSVSLYLFMPMLYGTGQDVGNGGDPVQQKIENARLDALRHLALYRPDRIYLDDWQIYQDVVAFLKRTWEGQTIDEAMYEDLRTSRYIFVEDTAANPVQTTCARTNLSDIEGGKTTVRYSLTRCREIDSSDPSIFEALVLHESAHHLGLTDPSDEALAIRVGAFLVANAKAASDVTRSRRKQLSRRNAPDGRWQHEVVYVQASLDRSFDNSIVVFGGCHTSHITKVDSCKKYLNSGSIYHFETGIWSPIQGPDNSLGRAHFGMSQISHQEKDHILIWGGCRDDEGSCRDKLNSGYIFDLSSDQWSAVPTESAPSSRSDFTFIPYKDSVFIWGGAETFRNRDRPLGDGKILKFSSSEEPVWQNVSREGAPQARYGQKSIRVDNKVYLWGGCGKQGIFRCREALDDGGVFDFSTGRWMNWPKPDFKLTGRIHHTMTQLGRFIVIWGGSDVMGNTLADGAMFDVKTNKWFPLSELSFPEENSNLGRTRMRSIASGNTVFFLGGENKLRYSSKILRLRMRDPLNSTDHVWSFDDALNPEDFATIGHKVLETKDGIITMGGLDRQGRFLQRMSLRQPPNLRNSMSSQR